MKRRMQQTMHKQRGLSSVEFAISGLATLLILFMAMEMARMMFTLNTLSEATRRGARVAAVCTLGNPQISRVAVFNNSGSGDQSPILRELSTDNIVVEYLDQNGTVLSDAGSDPSVYLQIHYVRVRVVNYQHSMILPGMSVSFAVPEFPTTIPRESLGVPRPDQTSTCA